MSQKINIGIIGAGAMGAGIAQVAATAGHSVCLYDSNNEALNKAQLNLKATLAKLVEKNKITAEQSAMISMRINFVNALSELKNSELVIEAIIENLEIKQKVFSELGNLVSESCILATNTSSLSVTSIASAVKNPDRVIGIHFFNPAPLMPLVEIIPCIATSESVTSSAKEIITAMGKTVVLCKDTPGFIVNRIARPFYGEAMRIYEEGIADIATIDWAMKEKGFKMGPFELTDLIGHDVNYTVTETVWKQMYFDGRYKPAICQKRLVEAKMYGKKSGQGFYNYAEGSIMPEPRKNAEIAEIIFMRIISMLINEAFDAVYLKIASAPDIETAMTRGVNYPKGLIQWAEEIGYSKILDTLENLRQWYNEERYRPSVLLKIKTMAEMK